MTYEKVNRELIEEVEKITEEKKKFETQCASIGNAFLKCLEALEEKKAVEVNYEREEKKNMKCGGKGIIISNYRTFYILNKENKPMVLGRFKNEEEGPDKASELR